MTDHCSVCGTPLHRGRGSNSGSCAVCSVEICIRCTTFAFCPAHFQALSPRGRFAVKLVYRASWILPLCLLILLYYPGLPLLSAALTSQGAFPIVFFGTLLLPAIPIWKKNAWLKSIWQRDPGRLEQTYTVWKCKACGFENPTIAQTCGQCGRSM